MGGSQKKKRFAVAADKPTHSHQHQSTTTFFTSYYFLACLLIIATALLYGLSLKYPLVFDDLPFFVDPNLSRLGSSFFHLDLRWLSYASFGWTYNLVGHDWFWYRIGNLTLHAITSILLFVFFARLQDATAQPQDTVTQPLWPAFFAALIFALHPAAVYGVAYLVERSIIMATLFGIVSLICYMEGLARDNAKWFVVSALCYFLAVFSKEHSIMIPGVAAALTLLFHKPSLALIKKVWMPFSLYFAIGALIILRTKGLLGTAYEPQAAGILARMSERQEAIHIDNAYPLSVITQGFLFFKYLLLWTIPYTGWMSIDIRNQPFATHLLTWPQLPGFILFLAYPVVAAKLLLKGGRQGLIGFGLLFPWILYLTELASIRIQEQFVLYRSYLWMSGLPIILLGFKWAIPRKFTLALLAAFCLALASLAWNRLNTFSDPIKLWTDAIEKYEDESLLIREWAYNNRGNAYFASGRLYEALADYHKSIKLNSGYPEGYNGRGNVYASLGKFSEALADYQKVIELNPKYSEGYYSSGNMYAKLNKFEKALHDYNTAIELKPDFLHAYEKRGVLLTKMGRHAEAFNDFDRAIRLSPEINPENILTYSNRAITNFNLGKFQETLNDFDKVLSLEVNNNQALLQRGLTLKALNRKSEAVESFRRSCEAGNPEGCKQLH